jgi:cold shock CspA family protein
MPTGRVIFFDDDKHCGFIEPDDRGPDIFIPGRAADAAGLLLREGMRLAYEVTVNPKSGKKQAEQLKAIG